MKEFKVFYQKCFNFKAESYEKALKEAKKMLKKKMCNNDFNIVDIKESWGEDYEPPYLPNFTRQMAIAWDIDDIKSIRPDLSKQQCFEVLRRAERKHDAIIGINWQFLEIIANDLFPENKNITMV